MKTQTILVMVTDVSPQTPFERSGLPVKAQMLFCFLTACGRIATGSPDADATVDVQQELDAGTPDAGVLDAPRDRNTSCGVAPEYGKFSCCEAGACRGDCSVDPLTPGRCHCGTVRESCTPPYVCCSGGCRTEAECAYAQDQP
jgi:hypothetical protein